MVKTEFYRKRKKDNVDLYISYSDEGFLIEKDGNLFLEAIDILKNASGYTETDIKPQEEEEEEE